MDQKAFGRNMLVPTSLENGNDRANQMAMPMATSNFLAGISRDYVFLHIGKQAISSVKWSQPEISSGQNNRRS